MRQEVSVWYLEMTEPGQLIVRVAGLDKLRVTEILPKDGRRNRDLYALVGGPWRWVDRLDWSEERWRRHAEVEGTRTWIAEVNGQAAGYFELEKAGDEVEVGLFGLAPAFIGRGYGGALLTASVQQAWAWGAGRVWLHTCSLDHPGAVENYCKSGFRRYRQETEWRDAGTGRLLEACG
jgi:GNAT superfamily N-acetyltransferase